MYLIFTVSLSVPCFFYDRSGDRMSACFFVFLHDRSEDFQVFLRKRCNSIIFRTGIRILPQFNIKAVFKFRCIRKYGILHFHCISKGQRCCDAICSRTECTCISSCFCILRNIKRYPYRLELIPCNIYRIISIKNIRGFTAVASIICRNCTVLISISKISSIVSFCCFYKYRAY